MGIERDVERMLRGESAEPSFLNDLSQKTYLIIMSPLSRHK